MSEPNYGIDPFFNSTYIANDCDLCGREFDYSVYESDTCSICDDKISERVTQFLSGGRK